MLLANSVDIVTAQEVASELYERGYAVLAPSEVPGTPDLPAAPGVDPIEPLDPGVVPLPDAPTPGKDIIFPEAPGLPPPPTAVAPEVPDEVVPAVLPPEPKQPGWMILLALGAGLLYFGMQEEEPVESEQLTI